MQKRQVLRRQIHTQSRERMRLNLQLSLSKCGLDKIGACAGPYPMDQYHSLSTVKAYWILYMLGKKTENTLFFFPFLPHSLAQRSCVELTR